MSYYKHRDTAWSGISQYIGYFTDIQDDVNTVIKKYLLHLGKQISKDEDKNARVIQKDFNSFKKWLKNYGKFNRTTN